MGQDDRWLLPWWNASSRLEFRGKFGPQEHALPIWPHFHVAIMSPQEPQHRRLDLFWMVFESDQMPLLIDVRAGRAMLLKVRKTLLRLQGGMEVFGCFVPAPLAHCSSPQMGYIIDT